MSFSKHHSKECIGLKILFKLTCYLATIYVFLYNTNIAVFLKPYDWLLLPYRTFSHQEKRISLDGLLNNKVQHDLLESYQNENEPSSDVKDERLVYIFVLDISKSVLKYDISGLDLYKKHINELIDKQILDANTLLLKLKGKKIKLYYAVVAQLYRMMNASIDVRTKYNKSNNIYNQFAVWTVGEKGNRMFPQKNNSNAPCIQRNKKLMDIKKEYVISAIKQIEQVVQQENFDNNTDFEHLLGEIRKDYEALYKNQDRPPMVITIFSDALHDVEGKIKNSDKTRRKDEIEKNWNALKSKINDISDYNIVANMIMVTPNVELEAESIFKGKNIYSVFKDALYHSPERFTGQGVKQAITQVTTKQDFLFYPVPEVACLEFHYENEDDVSGTVTLFSNRPVNFTIKMPFEKNHGQSQGLNLEWTIVKPEGADKSSGKLAPTKPFTTGGELESIELKLRCDLQYTPKLLKEYIPIRIIDHKKCKSYIAKIKFTKKLPNEIAIVIFIVQLLCISRFLMLIALLIYLAECLVKTIIKPKEYVCWC